MLFRVAVCKAVYRSKRRLYRYKSGTAYFFNYIVIRDNHETTGIYNFFHTVSIWSDCNTLSQRKIQLCDVCNSIRGNVCGSILHLQKRIEPDAARRNTEISELIEVSKIK